MAKNALSVEITAELGVSDETAKRCMALLEMWLDDNPEKNIVCDLVSCKDMVHHSLHIE